MATLRQSLKRPESADLPARGLPWLRPSPDWTSLSDDWSQYDGWHHRLRYREVWVPLRAGLRRARFAGQYPPGETGSMEVECRGWASIDS